MNLLHRDSQFVQFKPRYCNLHFIQISNVTKPTTPIFDVVSAKSCLIIATSVGPMMVEWVSLSVCIPHNSGGALNRITACNLTIDDQFIHLKKVGA